MLFSFLFISQIFLRFYRFLCATWLWVLLHLLTNLLSSIDRKQICPEPYFREYYIFIEMKLFLSIVIIYVQFNNLVAITFLFLSLSFSIFFPFSSFSLSQISMILDKLRHKIISSQLIMPCRVTFNDGNKSKWFFLLSSLRNTFLLCTCIYVSNHFKQNFFERLLITLTVHLVQFCQNTSYHFHARINSHRLVKIYFKMDQKLK